MSTSPSPVLKSDSSGGANLFSSPDIPHFQNSPYATIPSVLARKIRGNTTVPTPLLTPMVQPCLLGERLSNRSVPCQNAISFIMKNSTGQ